MKLKRQEVAHILFITIIVCIYFAKFFFPEPQLLVTPDYGRSDSWHFSLVTRVILSRHLHSGLLPVWIREMGNGFPLMAEGQTGTLFFINLFLFSIFDALTAYNLSFIFVSLFLGWGTYLWLRLLRIQPFISSMSALTFALSALVSTQLSHITLLQGFSMMPFIISFTHIHTKKPTILSFVALTFLISQQILTGYPQAVFITLLFCLGYTLLVLKKDKKSFLQYLHFPIVILFAIVLSSYQLFPSYEFMKHIANAGVYSQKAATQFSFPWKHFITFFNPYALGNPKIATYPHFVASNGSMFWENSGFIGLLPIVFLCLTPILYKEKDTSMMRLLAFGLVTSMLLMIGKFSPIYFMYSLWPFNIFRVPSRFIWIFVFFVISISTLTFQSLYKQLSSQIVRVVLLFLLVINICISIAPLYHYQAIKPAKRWLQKPEVAQYFDTSKKIYTITPAGIHNDEFMYRGFPDLEYYYFLRNALDPNSQTLWNYTHQDVYAGRFLKRLNIMDKYIRDEIEVDNYAVSISPLGFELLRLNNVGVIISHGELHHDDITLLGSVHDGIRSFFVYELHDTLPRLYFATQDIQVRTVEEALRALKDDSFILGTTVLLEDEVEYSTTSATATIIEEDNTTIRIEIKNEEDNALLVQSDTYYTGWKATIDNKELPIYPANISHRGIVIPKGEYILQLTYDPLSLRIGKIISTISYVILFLLLVVGILKVRATTKKQ